MAERVIKAALLGFGTVGGGVYKVLKMQQEEMVSKLGARVELKKILVRNIEKAAQKTDDPSLLTNNWKEIVDDPEIEIVIELIGGIEPARTYILEALEAGKNVVTANKDLIAADGHILLDTAAKNKKDFLHEAAVAGGIPIIRPIKQCLAGNHISEVMGIVNGTTNFILTKMSQNGMEFADALKLAQDLGYAESDPTADVEGLDAGRKVAILASAAFNSRVTFDDVYTEGITKITATDIEYANEMGCVIKLLGVARNTPEGIEARVHPMLIDVNHPLASVNDAYNAVFVQGDAVQDAMFYGRGAGELPTASAVVGDVFD
ncbi:MAG: homoserine dehydrogenase, partial [Lachnospiraceae bacterium]|nr:homoserine dehydrogenase [Lachnospiraceae bacterium]